MPEANGMRSSYESRYSQVLVSAAEALEVHLQGLFKGARRIDRISARAKSPDRFVVKASKVEMGQPKYNDPLNQIQDQLGARIVVYYRHDVDAACAIIDKYLRPIEYTLMVPESESEFGYFGKHYVLLLPSDVQPAGIPRDQVPPCFELQVKTLFQHAWAEANHDLAYKPNTPLTPEQQRLVAFTSAQAWGADEIFDRLQADLGTSS